MRRIEANVKFIAICFVDKDAIESMIIFRIDGSIIKSSLIKQLGHLVSLGVGFICIAY